MAQRGNMYGRPDATPIEQPITPRQPSMGSPDSLNWYAPPAYSPASTSSSCALANHSYSPPPNIGSSIACLRLKAQEYNTVMHNPYSHQMTQWRAGVVLWTLTWESGNLMWDNCNNKFVSDVIGKLFGYLQGIGVINVLKTQDILR